MKHALVWLLSGLGSVGCGQTAVDRDGGSFGLGLQVGAGATLSSASYTVEGPNGFLSAGTVAIGSSPDVSIVMSHLPVGHDYLVTIDATASDNATVCSGQATFDVSDSNAVFTVVVHLECAIPIGAAGIEATINLCPVLDGLDASPMDLMLGGVSKLTLSAHDSDTGPAALAYTWTVNGIKLARQTSPALSFTCSSPGEITIAAAVSDGDPNPACADSSAVKVTCQ